MGVSPSSITGSGPGGRIVEKDVLAASVARGSGPSVPLSSMRKTIARRLTESKQTVPHFYIERTVRADELTAFIAEAKKSGKVSVNDVVVKAVALALREFPVMRSRLEGDALVQSDECNVGVAVGLDEGLVVPAILHADKLGIHALADETRRIVDLARRRRIENAGRSQFTVSNLGMFGAEKFTAIINPPETGILAVGALRDAVIPVEGRPQVAKVLSLNMSCDHRVVDGVAAAKFLDFVANALESPARHIGGASASPIQVGNGGCDYDVAVVGSGPGGYVAALEAASLGAKVLIVDKSPNPGGTCLNFGCIPSKALLASASMVHGFRHAAQLGVRVTGDVTPDWGMIQARKDKIVSSLRGGIRSLFDARGVVSKQAHAKIAGRGRLALEMNGATSEVTAGAIIIATGTVPSIIEGYSVDGERVATTDDALHWKTLPKSLLIIGGGVIGVEFACMMAALGVTVTIVEKAPRLLPLMDEDLADAMKKILEKRGVTVHCASGVSDFQVSDAGCTATLEGGKKVAAERSLIAVGRKPVAAQLGLEVCGVRLDRGFVQVDGSMRAAPGIFCVGDANGRTLLAHAASAQGKVAAKAALGREEIFREPIPNAVYTFPEVASVGMTEAEGKKSGVRISVGKFPYRNLGKAMAIGETDGFVKVIRNTDSDELLGVHAIGHTAVEFISSALPLFRARASAKDLASLVYAHPSMGEAMAEAADDAFGQSLHLPPKALAAASA
jgi:dihydrolipoamide dehydrogenase